jgi:hypothetical protein
VIPFIAVWPGSALDSTNESARVPASLPGESLGPGQCWFGQVTVHESFDFGQLPCLSRSSLHPTK